MIRRLILAGTALLAAFALAGTANAQVSADGMGKVLPVELFACSYREGRDSSDLNDVIERWNAYADDNDVDDYAAWVLTKQFYTPTQEFDLIWMGAYSDFNAMGTGMDMYGESGGEIGAAFAEVIDCPAHVMLSSAMYKAPTDGTPESGVITMMDCELNEGSRYSDIKGAELKWAEHITANGDTSGYWHWFPTFGGGDSEFDYKVVSAFTNYAELGSAMEYFANGGGRAVSMGTFDDIDECDDPRVYDARSVRSAQLR